MSSRPSPVEACELVIRFDDWVRRVPLGRQPLVLGRADECDVQLVDPKISRRHCRILPGQDGTWLVEDLGSRTGTFLGGLPLQALTPIRLGERLQIGGMEAHIEPPLTLSSVFAGSERDARNMDLLLQTFDDMYASEDLHEVLRTIVDRTILLAEADRGALLFAGTGGKLEVGVARDASGRDLPPDQVLTRSLPSRALESGRAVVLTDAEAPEQCKDAPQSVFQGELRSVLCVPLPGLHGSMGVLYVDARKPADAFGPTELAVFQTLAVHGALAIERARRREEEAHRERETRRRLEKENAALRAQLGTEVPLGESPPLRQALDLVRRVAPSEATVCLVGETGTGKEVLARYLHRLSPRAAGPFVVVDCGSIPENLIESELFGHEKGAFTGAAGARAGRFREAQGGTVFLDEIGELPLGLQTRLLRVVQERTVQPIGGTGPVPINVRLVCATHRDLAREVAEGRFREDLYYRLSVVPVAIPPLRKRGQDVLLLAHHFLNRFGATYGDAVTGFTREAKAALLAHPWPGNVREMENRVQRAIVLARPPYVSRADLGLGGEEAESLSGPAEEDLPLPTLAQARAESNDRFERAYLEAVLRRSGGNVSRAAVLADVTRQFFQRLLRRHGVDRRLFTEEPA